MLTRRRYVVTDYLFSLSSAKWPGTASVAVAALAKVANVEVMTHPRNPEEFDYLVGPQCRMCFVCGDRRGRMQTSPGCGLSSLCFLGRADEPLRMRSSVEVDRIDELSWSDLFSKFADANIYRTWSSETVKSGGANSATSCSNMTPA